jgi:hypothetical protein
MAKAQDHLGISETISGGPHPKNLPDEICNALGWGVTF